MILRMREPVTGSLVIARDTILDVRELAANRDGPLIPIILAIETVFKETRCRPSSLHMTRAEWKIIAASEPYKSVVKYTAPDGQDPDAPETLARILNLRSVIIEEKKEEEGGEDMSGDRCLNGMSGCALTEPHRHEAGRMSPVVMDTEDAVERAGLGRCIQAGGMSGRCQLAAEHAGPHWWEGALLPPPPFYIPPERDIPNLGRWTPVALVDELIEHAMNLGTLKAPGGIMKLYDRLAELRAEVLRRLQ
jgi:hypothetical protein